MNSRAIGSANVAIRQTGRDRRSAERPSRKDAREGELFAWDLYRAQTARRDRESEGAPLRNRRSGLETTTRSENVRTYVCMCVLCEFAAFLLHSAASRRPTTGGINGRLRDTHTHTTPRSELFTSERIRVPSQNLGRRVPRTEKIFPSLGNFSSTHSTISHRLRFILLRGSAR